MRGIRYNLSGVNNIGLPIGVESEVEVPIFEDHMFGGDSDR